MSSAQVADAWAPRVMVCALAVAMTLSGCWVVELPSDPPDAGLSLDVENTDIFGTAGDLPNCFANETYCVGKVLYRCNKQGTEWVTEDCAKASKNCTKIKKDTFACSDMICEPNSGGCEDDGLTTRTCSADGKSWIKGMVCEFVKEKKICHVGKCSEACEPPSKVFNGGCNFFTANLPNHESYKVGFVVHNPGKLTAKVQLFNGTRGLASADIKPGKQATLIVDEGTDMVDGSARKKGWGFELSSNVRVEAMQISPLGVTTQDTITQRSSDGTMLLPYDALGDIHYAIAAPVSGVDDMSYVAVVGSYPNTKLTIIASTDTLAGEGIPALKKGQKYSTTLERKDLVVVATKTVGADISGTEIKADHRVAVFAGNTCVTLPVGTSHCDHIQEQILPVGSWGPGYVAVKFKPRGKTPEKDLWRIFAPARGTATLTISTGKGAPVIKKLKAGEIYDFVTTESFAIWSPEFIGVAHFALGQAAVPMPLDKIYSEGFESTEKCPTSASEGNLGDPAMSMLVPHRNFGESYNVLVPKNFKYDFLTITIPSRVNKPLLVLDGKLVTQPMIRIRGTYYFYTQLRVTDGHHTLTANGPFGVEVHGYDCNTGYAYNGGMEHGQTTPF